MESRKEERDASLEAAAGAKEGGFRSRLRGFGSFGSSFGGKDMFFRADKIDLKSLDVQLENQLNKVWNKGKGSSADRPKEEWEIDLSKLEIRYEVARGTYGTVYRGTYDGQDVAVKLLDWGEDGLATDAETAALRSSFQQEVAVWHKLDHPNVTKVHLDYLEAGANIIISASYQATIQGLESKGFSREESEALLCRSVEIACEARDMFRKRSSKQKPILVAASVGSYGAYLADGSEYSGDYGKSVTLGTLKDFHRRRVQVLAESGADLIAFETTPNKLETQAYAELLEEENLNIPVWFSFNSKDGVHVVSGDSLTECASIADSCKKVVALGINCTPPRFIHNLILSIKKVTEKPILIYPNSGETYDADKKEWVASSGVSDEDFVSYVSKWRDAGASLIGGCCRTTPRTIRAISSVLCKVADN